MVFSCSPCFQNQRQTWCRIFFMVLQIGHKFSLDLFNKALNVKIQQQFSDGSLTDLFTYTMLKKSGFKLLDKNKIAFVLTF